MDVMRLWQTSLGLVMIMQHIVWNVSHWIMHWIPHTFFFKIVGSTQCACSSSLVRGHPSNPYQMCFDLKAGYGLFFPEACGLKVILLESHWILAEGIFLRNYMHSRRHLRMKTKEQNSWPNQKRTYWEFFKWIQSRII